MSETSTLDSGRMACLMSRRGDIDFEKLPVGLGSPNVLKKTSGHFGFDFCGKLLLTQSLDLQG